MVSAQVEIDEPWRGARETRVASYRQRNTHAHAYPVDFVKVYVSTTYEIIPIHQPNLLWSFVIK